MSHLHFTLTPTLTLGCSTSIVQTQPASVAAALALAPSGTALLLQQPGVGAEYTSLLAPYWPAQWALYECSTRNMVRLCEWHVGFVFIVMCM